MILENLFIESARGMNGVGLSDLKPLSLVVGENNAGKSTVLESAAILMRPVDPTQWVQVARQRDLDMDLVDGLWSLFPTGEPLYVDEGPRQTKRFRVSGDIENKNRKVTAGGLASLSIGSEEDEDLTLRVEVNVSEDNRDLPPHTLEFRRRSRAQFGEGVHFYRCFTITPATHRSTRQLVDFLSKAIDEGKKELAVELLSLFDPEVVGMDVSTSSGRDGVRVKHAIRGVVDLASFGDGMRRAAALALALVRAEKGLLLVDELEAGIHPRVLPDVLARLMRAAELADVQILATTHSLEAIDGVIESLGPDSDRAAAFYVRRSGNGHQIKRYDQHQLEMLRETGLDIR